jgi:RNA polymerase sigma-70 factor (ECF subfamily)
LARDPTAAADLAAFTLQPLVRSLRAQFPRVDLHTIEEVAIDVILDLAEQPERFDPARSSLRTYLRMAAQGDLKNWLRSERRRGSHVLPMVDVDLSARAGKRLVDGTPDPAAVLASQDIVSAETLALVRASFSDVEWDVVLLMTEGERRTATYARILGLAEQSEIAQARAVKRVKDRLLKRLQRLAPKVPRDG